jgi:hypothetical protein
MKEQKRHGERGGRERETEREGDGERREGAGESRVKWEGFCDTPAAPSNLDV